MFITLTIDTSIKKKKNSVRIKRQSVNVAKGWRMAIHSKKRSFMQKMKDWRADAKRSSYKLGDQAVMFR